MNEEEKKAIEYYSNEEISISVDFDTEKLLKALGMTEEDSFENHQIRFKTLLNLITKLQKENEELKVTVNKQSTDISNNLIELQQKDRQIDLMAEYIATLDIEEDICNKTENQNCDKLDFEVCKDCVRQYYKRLVEKEE